MANQLPRSLASPNLYFSDNGVVVALLPQLAVSGLLVWAGYTLLKTLASRNSWAKLLPSWRMHRSSRGNHAKRVFRPSCVGLRMLFLNFEGNPQGS